MFLQVFLLKHFAFHFVFQIQIGKEEQYPTIDKNVKEVSKSNKQYIKL
tara:strand:+ start:1152 stop:1295 length:144 start_codon:yes stop_codon:yes gene_type:complete